MKIKNKKSYINKSAEGKAPNRFVVKLAHWFYISILLLILAYFIYSVYLFFVTYEGFGHVRVDKTLLSSSYDGKIINLAIKEGDKVEKDRLLTILKPAKICKIQELEQVKEDKRIIQLEYEIRIKQAKINVFKNQIFRLKKPKHQLILRRALEIEDKYLKDRKLAQRLKDDLTLLAQEIAIKRDLLNQLKNQFNSQANNQVIPDNCPNEFIYAPFKGIIKRVFLKLNEFSKRGKGVVLIQPENASVRIEAFLSKKELQYLKIKQIVTITFPDGITSTGVVKDILSSAYEFPVLERDNYEPIDVRIRVHIKPVNNLDALLWKKYDLLRVRIRGDYE